MSRHHRGRAAASAARVLPALWLAAAAACASSGAATSTTATPAGAPADAAESGAFVVTLGVDTLTIERFTRTANRLEGDIMQRSPTTVVGHYVASLDAAGRPTRLEYSVRRPDGSAVPNAPRSVTLTFAGDSVRREIQRDTVIRQTFVAPNAFPFTNNSFALYETALRALRATRADTGALPLLGLGASQTQPWPVRFTGPTSARVYYFGDPQQVTLDAQGRVLAIDGTGTTNKIRVARVASLDLPALAQSFAAREAAGVRLGQTTRDTARATAGGATLWVDYGRPLTRGRQIFGAGGVVPPGQVWRTGANEATQLRTDKALTIGNLEVPAGAYTLWTLPNADGTWKLIVNKNVGQWGTEYRVDQDLGRVDLKVDQLPTPVERFTIGIEPAAQGGTLALSWDKTRLSVPFTVKP